MNDSATAQPCPRPVTGRWGASTWICVLADGHDGDCQPPIEEAYYDRPFTARDQAWLASEAGLLLLQRDHDRRDQREALAREERIRAGMTQLLAHAYRHGGGRTAKHDATCWLRHSACLARAALDSPDTAAEMIAAAEAATTRR